MATEFPTNDCALCADGVPIDENGDHIITTFDELQRAMGYTDEEINYIRVVMEANKAGALMFPSPTTRQ